MNESNAKSGWWNWAVLAVMLASAGICVWQDIQRRFVSSGAIQATRRIVTTDQTLADAGRAGPVGLQFVNCDGQGREFAYFRAVYDLYPLPVVVANSSDVVFDAGQIPSGMVRSADWWRGHGVRTVVTVDEARHTWEAESTANPSGPG